ncbi:MAG: response regulator [Spirochaetes bacterium]|nr:response regulator [Spirochaetota bacterium]
MKTLRLLIVEDEMIIASMLAEILTGRGHEVIGIAGTGDEAIALIEALGPDLVFMDIKLKGKKDGIETAEEIYLRYRVPVIYMTAHSDNETVRRAETTVSYGYVMKPFRENEIFTSLDEALVRIKSERKNQKDFFGK